MIFLLITFFIFYNFLGCGVDIGCSLNGDVYLVGCGRGTWGFPLFRWNRAADSFCLMDGSGIKIDGAPNGAVWVVNSHNLIFKRENNRYINIDGMAHDITCANNGDVYHIGNEFSIWKRSVLDWIRIDGQGQSCSCGLSLWVIRHDGCILH